MNDLKNIIKLIRAKHWIKNSIILLPIFFSGQIMLAVSFPVITLLISFCLAASAIYVLNDIIDVDHDRANPNKMDRPIASGDISIKKAYLIFGTLAAIVTAIIVLFYSQALLCVVFYFILNVFYSYKLKQIAIVDVTCISLGFILRILSGSIAAGVFLSHWMIIMVFLLMISIAFAKRRDDFTVKMSEKNARPSKAGYSVQFLDMAKSMSFAITLVAYILYTVSPEVQERFGTDKLYITGLFVFLGIMRYLQQSIVFETASSPVKLLYKDRFLQITIFLWLLTFTFIIYGKNFELGIFS